MLLRVALPRLADLTIEVHGKATLDAAVPALRSRCPALASARIRDSTVGVALLLSLSTARVPATFVRCTVVPGGTDGTVACDPLLRFL